MPSSLPPTRREEVQTGIVREKKIDLERKKQREEREKELEKLKAWAPGRACSRSLCLAMLKCFNSFFCPPS